MPTQTDTHGRQMSTRRLAVLLRHRPAIGVLLVIYALAILAARNPAGVTIAALAFAACVARVVLVIRLADRPDRFPSVMSGQFPR